MDKKNDICLDCGKTTGRNYLLIQHECGCMYCGHCGKASGTLKAWWEQEDFNKSKTMDTCKWKQNGFSMLNPDYWETTCDNVHQFITGGPKENHFEFCPYCGKPIEVVEKGESDGR